LAGQAKAPLIRLPDRVFSHRGRAAGWTSSRPRIHHVHDSAGLAGSKLVNADFRQSVSVIVSADS